MKIKMVMGIERLQHLQYLQSVRSPQYSSFRGLHEWSYAFRPAEASIAWGNDPLGPGKSDAY